MKCFPCPAQSLIRNFPRCRRSEMKAAPRPNERSRTASTWSWSCHACPRPRATSLPRKNSSCRICGSEQNGIPGRARTPVPTLPREIAFPTTTRSGCGLRFRRRKRLRHRNPQRRKKIRHGRICSRIRACHAKTALVQHAGQRRHCRPANADQMNMLVCHDFLKSRLSLSLVAASSILSVTSGPFTLSWRARQSEG